MKATLIKRDNRWEGVHYILKDEKDWIKASTLSKEKGLALSMKNCQAIERGYDLDEIAEQEFPYDFDCPLFETLGITEKSHKSILIGMLQGTLQKGFQKAIELMGDKKFSEDFLKRMCSISFNFYKRNDLSDSELEEEWENWLKNTIQSLQPVEWDVEVQVDTILSFEANQSNAKVNPNFGKPLLDKDGCLILKRI